MLSGKHFKVCGVSYGLVGDLVMGIPCLTYFEKKYPGCYKLWFIEKKVAQMGQFFLNHPLIDRIKITDEWSGFGIGDYGLASQCDYQCSMGAWKHNPRDWYNHRGCIEETARLAGINDIVDVLDEDELYPYLHKWFDVGPESASYTTYSKQNNVLKVNDNIISIFPFATGNGNIARSPSVKWWNDLLSKINGMGYKVWQFGSHGDPQLDGVVYFNTRTFFEQVKMALATRLTVGTDSGNMWVMGAYSQPAVHVITNWCYGHYQNFDALIPVNKNGRVAFAEGGADNVRHEDVLAQVKGVMCE